jgi:hypothetical protein
MSTVGAAASAVDFRPESREFCYEAGYPVGGPRGSLERARRRGEVGRKIGRARHVRIAGLIHGDALPESPPPPLR